MEETKINPEDFFSEQQLLNIKFFKENLEQYLENPLLFDKYVVIHDEKLINSFDNFQNAARYAFKNLPRGEFIIQRVYDESKIISCRRAVVYLNG